MRPLLSVENLSVEFAVGGARLQAVSGVSFEVASGEVLALVGESGCGKSVTCMSLARLLPEPPARYASGRVLLDLPSGERDVLRMSGRELRGVRGGFLAYVFQEPSVSLNPVFRVGNQIAEAITLHRPDIVDVDAEVARLLGEVGIADPAARARAYPHELSGGMQQRVMIAMALASAPRLLVADEPTTALDVTIQAQILDLLKKLRKMENMTVILVTHNLGIVAEMADRVIVMYAGHTVEEAPTAALLDSPAHPYTRALLAAVPTLYGDKRRLTTIPGSVPSPAAYPPGCRFYGRCQLCESLPEAKRALCAERVPEWRVAAPGHRCRCWYSPV